MYLDDKSFTASEWLKSGAKREAWIVTHCGVYQVSYIDQSYWAHTPKANGGFGMSWCIHAGTPFYVSEEIASKVKLAQEQQARGETPMAFAS